MRRPDTSHLGLVYAYVLEEALKLLWEFHVLLRWYNRRVIFQQALPVLREHRRVEAALHQVHVQEPSVIVSHRINSSFGSLLEYDLSKTDNSQP